MGRAPEPEMMQEILQSAAAVPGVHEVVEVRGHYVGTFVHVELTARVDGRLSTIDSHAVAEAVRAAVEAHAMIDRAFVHIEPAGEKSA